MTPIEPKQRPCPDRDQKMQAEIQAFLDAGCDAAELWKDESVTTGRNVDLYARACRRMRIEYGKYDLCQRRGKVIIKKRGVIV